MPISTFGTVGTVNDIAKAISNLTENDIDAFSDAVDRSGVLQTIPGGGIAKGMMPLAVKPAGKMAVKLIQMLNNSRLAKVASKMPAFRYQEEAAKDFISNPARGSIFTTIGNIADRMHPTYNTNKVSGIVGEGGKNFVMKSIEAKNPLMVDPRKNGLGANTVQALKGHKFASDLTHDLDFARDPDEVLKIAKKYGNFNNNELRRLAEHTSMAKGSSDIPGASFSRMALIRDALAAKQGKFYGFDTILPNVKNKGQAAEMMILK